MFSPTSDQATIPAINKNELITQLQHEGFSHAYVWEDMLDACFPDHTDRMETAHIVLSVEMPLTMAGKSKLNRRGDRCPVPAGAVHLAVMGPQGCPHLIGERPAELFL